MGAISFNNMLTEAYGVSTDTMSARTHALTYDQQYSSSNSVVCARALTPSRSHFLTLSLFPRLLPFLPHAQVKWCRTQYEYVPDTWGNCDVTCGETNTVFADLWEWNPDTMKFSERSVLSGVSGDVPEGRHSHAMASVGSTVYVHGGARSTDSTDLTNEFYSFDTIQWRWVLLTADEGVSGTPPTARFRHAMAAVGHEIFLFGGYTNGGKSAEVFEFDTILLTWVYLAATGTSPSRRDGHAMISVGIKLFVFGGKVGPLESDYSDEAFEFDTGKFEWSLRASSQSDPAPKGRQNHAMASLGSQVFLYGGSRGQGEKSPPL